MMFQRSCGDRFANDAIGVSRTPTDTTLYARDGVNVGVALASPVAGTGTPNAFAAGPSPRPRSPWHDAQFAVNSAWPLIVSRGAVGRSRAPAAPSAPLKRAATS